VILIVNQHACRLFIVSFSYIYISQGSVATQLRCGRIFTNLFIANFPASVSVKEFRKWVNIWQRYGYMDNTKWDSLHSNAKINARIIDAFARWLAYLLRFCVIRAATVWLRWLCENVAKVVFMSMIYSSWRYCTMDFTYCNIGIIFLVNRNTLVFIYSRRRTLSLVRACLNLKYESNTWLFWGTYWFFWPDYDILCRHHLPPIPRVKWPSRIYVTCKTYWL